MCYPGIFHKWTKWEQYNWQGVVRRVGPLGEGPPIQSSERRQRRHCEVCNKEQDELVKHG